MKPCDAKLRGGSCVICDARDPDPAPALDVYLVRVEGQVIEYRTRDVVVLARSEDEAEGIAEDAVADDFDDIDGAQAAPVRAADAPGLRGRRPYTSGSARSDRTVDEILRAFARSGGFPPATDGALERAGQLTLIGG